jgi:hypothetical protein
MNATNVCPEFTLSGSGIPAIGARYPTRDWQRVREFHPWIQFCSSR